MNIPKQINGIDIEDLKVDTLCPSCGANKYYNDKYDALFCLKENKWLETGCHDPECEFCKDRPDKPIQYDN